MWNNICIFLKYLRIRYFKGAGYYEAIRIFPADHPDFACGVMPGGADLLVG
jgi:hypothetical protein